ncbi:PH (Pleckstrin Homology) domain-containing protein [Actinokineospora cianjurensis]|uniref:PH (Pleckstrin Homology) domain-containing protein n=1 Tax=Actinokineospora cianjurensis TaxID=585224 RepID=A0A421B4X5_9PSEU|nr:PH (Pleckstrin Homology) domain-containing protein [Actinokineospora cianjurensis]
MTARPRKVWFVTVPIAVVFIAVFAIVAALLRDSGTGVYFQVSDQVAMVGIGVLLAAGVLWLTWPKVTADADGITVRNLLGRTRYPWSAIVSISFPDGAAWARLELPDDEYVPVMAIQSLDGARAVTAIRALRGLHRAAVGSPDAAGTTG